MAIHVITNLQWCHNQFNTIKTPKSLDILFLKSLIETLDLTDYKGFVYGTFWEISYDFPSQLKDSELQRNSK